VALDEKRRKKLKNKKITLLFFGYVCVGFFYLHFVFMILFLFFFLFFCISCFWLKGSQNNYKGTYLSPPAIVMDVEGEERDEVEEEKIKKREVGGRVGRWMGL
jgi:predicted membrane protein